MDDKALRELLAAATPGPWEVLGDNQGHPCGLEWTIEAPHLANEDDTGWIAGVHGGDGIASTGNPGCRVDAELIVAAVNALPGLLDEIATVIAERDDYAEMLRKEREQHRKQRDTLRATLAAAEAERERLTKFREYVIGYFTETDDEALLTRLDQLWQEVGQEDRRAINVMNESYAGKLAKLSAAESECAALRELLGSAQNGLRWYQDEHPADRSEADEELHVRIDAALASNVAAGGG